MNGPTYDQVLLPNAHHPHQLTNLTLIQQFVSVGLKSEKRWRFLELLKLGDRDQGVGMS